MVKYTEYVEEETGYGSRGSDNKHFKTVITECSCELEWQHRRKYLDDDEWKTVVNKAIFHEKFHAIKNEVERYINKMGALTPDQIQKHFIHVPERMLEYTLEWITSKVDRYWIRYKTEKLINDIPNK